MGGEAGGELLATSRHPFWTQRGWVAAENLSVSDVLSDRSGLPVAIGYIAQESVDTPTFNLSVGEMHTFFVVVGETSVLVHNLDPWDIGFSRPVSSGEVFQHGPWRGRTVEAAVAEARALGRLPDGLELSAARYYNTAGDEVVAAINNRTLHVAQEAGLSSVSPVNDMDSARAYGALERQQSLARSHGGTGEVLFRCR